MTLPADFILAPLLRGIKQAGHPDACLEWLTAVGMVSRIAFWPATPLLNNSGIMSHDPSVRRVQFRPSVDRMTGYVSGEQPQEDGWVKLNTNENPYPPSPRVIEAIGRAAEGRLNLYPDPLGREFCRVAARLFDVDPDWIIPGNGSDEILTILLRTFVDPGQRIAYPYPSYVLYETLGEIQGAEVERIVLRDDWSWPMEEARRQLQECRLLFVPNPNSPSGNRFPDGDLLGLVPEEGVLVLDEAYGDFCDEPHGGELLKSDSAAGRMVVTRTLSKSYSLAGLRLGFGVAHPDVVAAMRKVKDSYNCDMLSLAAGVAALEDTDWMQENAARIRQTRQRLVEALVSRGFDVVPSQANFVWATHPDGEHRRRFEALKAQRVLVRYMVFPECDPVREGLRITVGTDEQVDRFLEALDHVGS